MSSFQKFWAFCPMILDHQFHNQNQNPSSSHRAAWVLFLSWFRYCPLNFSSGFSPSSHARPMCPLAFYLQKVQCFQWFRGEFEGISNEISESESRCLLPRRGEWAWGGREGMARGRTSFGGSGFVSGVVQAGQIFMGNRPKIKCTST